MISSLAGMMRVKSITSQPKGVWLVYYSCGLPNIPPNLGQTAVRTAKCHFSDFRLPIHSPPSHQFAQESSTTPSIVSFDSQDAGGAKARAAIKWHQTSPVYTSVSKKGRISGSLINSWNPLNVVSSFYPIPKPTHSGVCFLMLLPVYFINKCSI